MAPPGRGTELLAPGGLRPRGAAVPVLGGAPARVPNEALNGSARKRPRPSPTRPSGPRSARSRTSPTHQEYEDVLAREQALIAGHADMEFSGFVTVTAPSRDELAAAVAQIEQAVGQASCETRVLYGRQAQGFVVSALALRPFGHVREPCSVAWRGVQVSTKRLTKE